MPIKSKQTKLLQMLPNFAAAALMSSCFQGPGLFKQTSAGLSAEDYQIATKDEGGVSSGAFDPRSSVTQTISVATGSSLAGTSLSFPPGSLLSATSISIQEGSTIASSGTAAALSLGTTVSEAGPSVVISSSLQIDADKEFTVTIPTSGSGLFLDNGNMVVIYKIFKASTNSYFYGVFTADQLTIKDGAVSFDTKWFGSYQAARTEIKITKPVEVKSDTPVLTKNEEAKLPDIVWSLGVPVFLASDRSVELPVGVTGFATLKKCAVFTHSNPNTAWINVDETTEAKILTKVASGTRENYHYKITSDDAMTIYMRVECFDTNGRQAMSPWSQSVAVPVKPKEVPPSSSNSSSNSSSTTDTLAPIVGGSGLLTVTAATTDSLTITWSAATDNITTAADLLYELRQSSSNNISTLIEAETNGSVAMAYTANMLTKVVTSLTPNTTYYFNVIVKDSAGNKAAYNSKYDNTAVLQDNTAPTLNNGATISSSSLTHNSVLLNWNYASDDSTSSAQLQYKVFRASSSTVFSTIASTETSGIGVSSYVAGLTSYSVTSLDPATAYYFNVIVKDASGNRALYTTLNVTTQSAPSLHLDSPNGGQTLSTNTNVSISWSRTNFTGNVDVRFSTDNGTSWISIASNISGSTYTWVPSNSDQTANGKIQVIAAGAASPADESDAIFTIACGEPTGQRGTVDTNVLGNYSDTSGPQLATRAKDGTLYTFGYVSSPSPAIVILKSVDGGSLWVVDVTLTNTTPSGMLKNYKLLSTPNGDVYAFYLSNSNPYPLVYRKKPNNGSWGSSTSVSGITSAEAADMTNPIYNGRYAVASDSNSNVYIAFIYSSLLYYIRLGDSSAFTVNSAYASPIAMDIDASGKLYILYTGPYSSPNYPINVATVVPGATPTISNTTVISDTSDLGSISKLLISNASGNLMAAFSGASSNKYSEYTSVNGTWTWSSPSTILISGKLVGAAVKSFGDLSLFFVQNSPYYNISKSSKSAGSSIWSSAEYLAGTSSASTSGPISLRPFSTINGMLTNSYTAGYAFMYYISGNVQFLGSSDLSFIQMSCTP